MRRVCKFGDPAIETPARQKDRAVFYGDLVVIGESKIILLHYLFLLFDGNTLRQVAGLVNIATTLVGDVVSKQLEWN